MKRNELSLHRKEQMAASLKKLMTRKNLGRITDTASWPTTAA